MPALSALSMGSEPGLLPLALVFPLRRGEREKSPLQLVFFQVSAALSASVVQWPTCPLMLPLRRAENHLAPVPQPWNWDSSVWALANQQTLVGRETAFCRASWVSAGTARV